jgi:hypothetical protein
MKVFDCGMGKNGTKQNKHNVNMYKREHMGFYSIIPLNNWGYPILG